MVNWLKKRKETSEQGNVKNLLSDMRKPEEEDQLRYKEVKRLDNIRLNKKAHVSMRSLGSDYVYDFLITNISISGFFVECDEPEHYPFLANQTLIEIEIDLRNLVLPEDFKEVIGRDNFYLFMLAKIARISRPSKDRPNPILGYGMKIVQIEWEDKRILENIIIKYGKDSSGNLSAA